MAEHIKEDEYKGSADYIDIVFDDPPGPESGRFVEVEDGDGASISIGQWIRREDGNWALRIQWDEIGEFYNARQGF